MSQHPRTPGTLWDAIGWNRERERNIACDRDRGVNPVRWPLNPGRAA